MCNAHWGRYSVTLQLVYPYTPAMELGGGSLQAVQLVNGVAMPVYVPPDPTLAYRFDGVEMYPRNSSFLDYGQDGSTGRVLRSRES